MPDTIEDIEADIMWLEEAIGENEERLEELTSENYKPEENADDEYREQDIEELNEGIAEYRREIAKCQRKIERLKRAQQNAHLTSGGLCAKCGSPSWAHGAIGHEFIPPHPQVA